MIEGWERLLAEHITEATNKPFKWGAHDCALWCADWKRKATGQDIGKEWRGRYRSEKALLKLLAERGLTNPSDIADLYLTPKPLAFASRGDILQHPCGTLGICVGANGVFVTRHGVLYERTMNCSKAWGIE